MTAGISFNWDIHWACNFRCPYCWFHGKWEEIAPRNVYPPYERLVAAWKKMHERHGTVKIAITGGEPFLYPRFAEFIAEMSPLHRFMIISNLSVEVDDFVRKVRPENVAVNPSFHPLGASAGDFIRRARTLKDAGMMQCITLLAWPPFIEKIAGYQEEFGRHGMELTLQSFFGEYEGRRYPDSYTDREKAIIMPQLGSRGGEKFQTEAFSPKGRLCRAGQRYGVIHPDGTLRRCGGLNSADAVVGNIFDENFELLAEPRPCTSDVCPCNEWAFLLVGR